MIFKDLFSAQAVDYARFRPSYPPALFAWLASVAPGRACAVDVATGNGQAAQALAPHFARVIALDASASQLDQAPPCANVTYRVAAAEATGVAPASADLVTAAQALHWFRLQPFFAEADRILRPGGVLAVWCYGLARIDPAVDAIVSHLYADILGAYWEPERRLVEDGYGGIAFPSPFWALAPPLFEMQLEWTLPDLLGYLRTWSALRAFVRRQGTDPVAPLEPALSGAWGGAASAERKTARWTLSVRAARR